MDTELSFPKTDQVLRDQVLSDADIVPDDLQNELIHYRDLRRKNSFAIGDIANQLVERSAYLGFPVTDQRVFQAVGRYCDLRPRTVRYCAETSAFFDERVREEYDMLPFSHFVFARSLDTRWQEVLEYSAVHPGISVDYLRYVFLGLDAVVELEKACAPDEPCSPACAPTVLPTVVCATPPAPEPIEPGTFRFAKLLSALSEATSSLERLLGVIRPRRDTLSKQASVELEEALATVRKWLPEIARLDKGT